MHIKVPRRSASPNFMIKKKRNKKPRKGSDLSLLAPETPLKHTMNPKPSAPLDRTNSPGSPRDIKIEASGNFSDLESSEGETNDTKQKEYGGYNSPAIKKKKGLNKDSMKSPLLKN